MDQLGSTAEIISLALVLLVHLVYVISKFTRQSENIKSLNAEVDHLKQNDARHEERLNSVSRIEGKIDAMLTFFELFASKDKN